MESSNQAAQTPDQRPLSRLEQALFEIGLKGVTEFESILTSIKNNHGLNTSAVETLLGEGQKLVDELRAAINQVVAHFTNVPPPSNPSPQVPVGLPVQEKAQDSTEPNSEGIAQQQFPSQPTEPVTAGS